MHHKLFLDVDIIYVTDKEILKKLYYEQSITKKFC